MIEIKRIILLDSGEIAKLDLSSASTGLFLEGEDGTLYGGLSTDVVSAFYDLEKNHSLYDWVSGVDSKENEQ